MKVKAALITAPGTIEIVPRELPEPSELEAGKVLLRVRTCALCTGSELPAWTGASPVPEGGRRVGHEYDGIVEAVAPDVRWPRVGDHVVSAEGDSWAFSEMTLVEAINCRPVPDNVAFPALAEPLQCALNALENTSPRPGDTVVVIGATGYIGELYWRLLATRGPRLLILAGRRDEALQPTLEQGATHIVNTGRESLVDRVLELTDGRGVDIAAEATGRKEDLVLLGDIARKSGKVAALGWHEGDTPIPLGTWQANGLEQINGHEKDPNKVRQGMDGALSLMRSGVMNPPVTHHLEWPNVRGAFETADARPEGFHKALITFPE